MSKIDEIQLEEGKTILMPNKDLAGWLAGMRSGEYRQSRGRLCTIRQGQNMGYCCLGVMQVVMQGDVERDNDSDPQGLPSIEWLEEHGIRFLGERPESRARVSPFLPSLKRFADGANDGVDADGTEDGVPYNFLQIADAIEACAQGYDP